MGSGPSLAVSQIVSAAVPPAVAPRVSMPPLRTDLIGSSVPIITQPSVVAHPSAPATSRPAISRMASSLQPPTRPATSRLASTVPDIRSLPIAPSPILPVPDYEGPVKERYDTDIGILKELTVDPNADKKEAALRSRMKKDYIVVNHEDENINVDEVNHNISFEVNFLHRNEAGDLTTVATKVSIKIGDLCDISKDETGKPKVVLDRGKAKQSIRDYYFRTSETPEVPLNAVKVLFARQLIDERELETKGAER